MMDVKMMDFDEDLKEYFEIWLEDYKKILLDYRKVKRTIDSATEKADALAEELGEEYEDEETKTAVKIVNLYTEPKVGIHWYVNKIIRKYPSPPEKIADLNFADKTWLNFVAMLKRAVDLLMKIDHGKNIYCGTVYRRTKDCDELEKAKSNDIVQFTSYTSTSTDDVDKIDGIHGNITIKIEKAKGLSVKKMSICENEAEVILPLFQKFKIKPKKTDDSAKGYDYILEHLHD